MIKLILAILFVIFVATFCTLNREEIILRYFFGWRTDPFPLFLLILASLVVGMVVGFSVDWGERWKLRAKARNIGKQVTATQNEIEALKARGEKPEAPSELPEASKTADS